MGELQDYDDAEVFVLEQVWGEGYLSPGGPDEVRRIVDGVDFTDTRVLDIGCGTGGIALFLDDSFGPAEVVGVDVDQGLVGKANEQARSTGVSDHVKFQTVDPGTLPFDDGSFDIVFSKDAMIHIANKEALFSDIYRVLRPGGVITACDWMSQTNEHSADMLRYIELENLGFAMGSPDRYERALIDAGFQDVVMTDRNAWYRSLVAEEVDALSGRLYQTLVDRVGRDFVDHSIEVWRALQVVVDSGEHRPTHMRGIKPHN